MSFDQFPICQTSHSKHHVVVRFIQFNNLNFYKVVYLSFSQWMTTFPSEHVVIFVQQSALKYNCKLISNSVTTTLSNVTYHYYYAIYLYKWHTFNQKNQKLNHRLINLMCSSSDRQILTALCIFINILVQQMWSHKYNC